MFLRSFRPVALALGLALIATPPAGAAPAPQAQVVESFADLTDLTLPAPIVLQAVITKAKKLNAKAAPDVPPGRVRMLVEAQVQNLLVAPDAVPARISYLWEGPVAPKGKAPKLKDAPVMLFLQPVPGREGQFRLNDAYGQIAWTPQVDQTVRRILAEARGPELHRLAITGIGNAFHVRGTIPGEAESQIFLTTATGRPVSLVVLSRPGQAKSFSVALGDVIDEASSRTVARDTLLWYHLACTLPPQIPAQSIAELDEADQAAVTADYRFVLDSVGSCGRTLDRPTS